MFVASSNEIKRDVTIFRCPECESPISSFTDNQLKCHTLNCLGEFPFNKGVPTLFDKESLSILNT